MLDIPKWEDIVPKEKGTVVDERGKDSREKEKKKYKSVILLILLIHISV